MMHGSHYLGKLYNDLIANSPQTISMDCCTVNSDELWL